MIARSSLAHLFLAVVLGACSSAPVRPLDISEDPRGWKGYRVWPTISKVRGQVGGVFQSRLGFRNTEGRPSWIKDPEFLLRRSLPQGLSFDRGRGVIHGVPAEPGYFSVRIGVRDRERGTHTGRGWYMASVELNIREFNDLR
jgi:hypothetical protein